MTAFVNLNFILFFFTEISNRNLRYLENSSFYKHFIVGNVVIFSYSFFCLYCLKSPYFITFSCNYLHINLLRKNM